METNKQGLDELFQVTGRIIDDIGEERILTWEALDDQLRAAVGKKESTKQKVEDALEGLEAAKGWVRKREKEKMVAGE